MVSRTQKHRAVDYICERLEESGLYSIRRKDYRSASIVEKPEAREQPRKIKVIIPNFLDAIDSFDYLHRFCRERDIYLAPIFYKDGKTAFVRMVERNPSWRMDKSLKEYNGQEINQMLHLRGMEKAVMEHFGDEMTYYQPETIHLEESLRIFEWKNVHLDYSHISSDHQAYDFVKNRDSIDYKLPKETEVITGAAEFAFALQQPDFYRRAWITPGLNEND